MILWFCLSFILSVCRFTLCTYILSQTFLHCHVNWAFSAWTQIPRDCRLKIRLFWYKIGIENPIPLFSRQVRRIEVVRPSVSAHLLLTRLSEGMVEKEGRRKGRRKGREGERGREREMKERGGREREEGKGETDFKRKGWGKGRLQRRKRNKSEGGMGFKRKRREVDVGLKVRGGGSGFGNIFEWLEVGERDRERERKTGGVKHDREKGGYLFSGLPSCCYYYYHNCCSSYYCHYYYY